MRERHGSSVEIWSSARNRVAETTRRRTSDGVRPRRGTTDDAVRRRPLAGKQGGAWSRRREQRLRDEERGAQVLGCPVAVAQRTTGSAVRVAVGMGGFLGDRGEALRLG